MIFQNEVLQVIQNPRLNHVYPRYLDVDKLIKKNEAYFFLVGHAFDDLKFLQGFYICVLSLHLQDGSIKILFASETVKAFIMSPNVLVCPITAPASNQLS